jgi:protein phosphatase
MKTFSITDIGVEREMNQDYLFTSDTVVGNLPNLYIVADGMGGHKAGEYASRYTTERVVAYVLRSKDSEPVTILKEAIQKANELLLIESKEDEAKHGMGTTIVCATIIGSKMFVANVGDSRLYVVSDGIRQITRDHSLVEEMVRMGEMDRQDARKHPDKNIITRAVGVTDTVDVDFFEVDLSGEDEILLCTDGLTNMVDDMTIHRIMTESKDLEQQVAALVKTANDNGGRDNITAVIIRPNNDEVKTC